MIASVIKTHGCQGEVVVAARRGLPCLVREGLELVLVPPALKGPRRFVVTSCSGEGDTRLVAFKGVSDLAAASALVGRHALARVSDLGEDFLLVDAYAIIGREVVDESLGSLGTVEEVMRGPANDVWVVRGSRGEVLVPVVDHMVLDASGEGAIRVDLPHGILMGDDAS